MPVRAALLLAALVFVLTLLVRMPASLLLSHLPGALRCEGATGTVWQGSCEQLAFGKQRVSDVRWTLHPGALLRARIALDLLSADPAASAQASLEWRPGGDLLIEHLTGTFAPQELEPLLPAGWSASLQLAIGRARVSAGRLVGLEGTVDLRQLQLRTPRVAFGSYELSFAPTGANAAADAPLRGSLRDLAGPLSLRGQILLTPTGSYMLAGSVAAHGEESPELEQLLALLGPPDQNGTRDFSLAGTL
jgi:hypothetical protein